MSRIIGQPCELVNREAALILRAMEMPQHKIKTGMETSYFLPKQDEVAMETVISS